MCGKTTTLGGVGRQGTKGNLLQLKLRRKRTNTLDCGFKSLFGFMDANQACKIFLSTLGQSEGSIDVGRD